MSSGLQMLREGGRSARANAQVVRRFTRVAGHPTRSDLHRGGRVLSGIMLPVSETARNEIIFGLFVGGVRQCVGGPSADEVDQTHRWDAAVLDVHEPDGGCKAAVCCWPCLWELDPDLWISPDLWRSSNPVVPYEHLPDLDHDADRCWEPSSYAFPEW